MALGLQDRLAIILSRQPRETLGGVRVTHKIISYTSYHYMLAYIPHEYLAPPQQRVKFLRKKTTLHQIG